MGFPRRKKPLSPLAEARAKAAQALLDDCTPPPEGWPAHYTVHASEKGLRYITVHFCRRCGETLETTRGRGAYPMHSRAFSAHHRDCTPRAQADDPGSQPAEVPDGL